MGFYLRKSVRVGPFRFNFSGSGVGVSAGVKGFRVGTGPRGNYVHMGVGGICYRATIPSDTRSRNGVADGDASSGGGSAGQSPAIPPGTHDELREIESASAATIVDSSSAELLQELNEKRKKPRLAPVMIAVTILACLVAYLAPGPAWLVPSAAVLGGLGTWFAHRRDLVAKTAVVFYELETEVEQVYGVLHEHASQMASCAAAWHVEAQGRVHDRKYHAGASSLVRRSRTFIRKCEPPFLKTNVESVAISVGKQTLHFFPDRVLIFEPNGVGAVGYGQLQLTIVPTRFIEDGSVPSDAQVVDYTWKYVNKKGGPDRRFKDNRQLPVCLYDEVTFRSSTGLNEVIQVSRPSVAAGFAQAIAYLAARLPPELQRPAA